MSKKIVLVSGATSGIGKATAELFAKNNFNLIITGRRKERLVELANELSKTSGAEILPLCFDVQKREEVKKSLESIPAQWRKIHVLVNNAGLASGLNSFQEGDLDDWEKMIDTNLKGLLYVTRIIAPWMIENKEGHIINIGSIAGKETYANGNVYCATKHAVDSLSKAMRIDLLSHGIKVTQVNPGMVETEFSIVRFKGDQEKAKKVYQGLQSLTAEDIADAIFWAASRPGHVNINDIIIMPTAQANATNAIRKP